MFSKLFSFTLDLSLQSEHHNMPDISLHSVAFFGGWGEGRGGGKWVG